MKLRKIKYSLFASITWAVVSSMSKLPVKDNVGDR